MEGDDLICNYKKCRKRLTNVAYVTACSHVFCDEDGTREFNKSTKCPACDTDLASKFEIVRNNLQPSEQYKSMILAGLKPDIVTEVCSRALSFWVYQSHQEKTYQEYMANKSKERASQLEQYYEQIVARTSNELTSLKDQLTAAKKENDDTKKRFSEISDKLMERNRQHQKLQSMYESLRRKFITMSSFASTDSRSTSVPHGVHSTVLASGDAVPHFGPAHLGTVQDSTSKHGFDFRPNTDCGDMPANHVQKKFSVNLGTPRQ